MAYTETTTTGYGTRLGNSVKGIGTGILMFILGTVLLWWNEGRAVKTSDANEAAYEQTQVVNDISVVDNNLNGKMIHASGDATTQDILKDPDFGLSVNATCLRRDVEYYQWVEHASTKKEDKFGGKEEKVTTYTYELKWVSQPVSSADFHDPAYQGRNTVKANYKSEATYADHVMFGAYQLPSSLISSIRGDEPVDAEIPENVAKSLKQRGATITGNQIYFGNPSVAAEVGDVRITFRQVRPTNLVTVWAQQQNQTFVPFVYKNGYQVYELYMGTQSLDQSYQQEQDSNSFMSWVLRLLGFILIYSGLKSLFGFLITLFKVVPFLSTLVDFGASLICGLVAAVWSLLIIAIAWIAYRPILAICLLAIAGGLVYFFVKRSKDKKKQEVANNNDTPTNN